MSTFDNPFDAKSQLNSSGCSCGRHVSQAAHDERLAAPMVQVEGEEKRYEDVVASAVIARDVSRRTSRAVRS